MRILASILFILLTSISAQAATYTSADCSRANVQAKVDLATHGDTVNVTSGGVQSYTAYLRVQKNITLDLTGCTIQDNVTKDGGYASGWLWYTVTPTSTTSAIARITGNAMQGIATDPSIFQKGHIVIDGSSGGVSANLRLDHLSITTAQTAVIRTYGWVWGVVDHVTMVGSSHDLLQAGHDGWGGSTLGDGSWFASLTPGTDQAIYVEDSTLTASGNPYVTNFADGLEGARVVIRYNTFTQGNITSHGTDTGGRRRGIRWQEFYNNILTFPADMPSDFIAWFRGGSGVMYGNAVTALGGINYMAKVHNYRDDNNVGVWGLCNGTSPYDQNSVGQTGYRCVDQPGSGTSNNLNGVDPPPSSWVNNTLEPIYVWGNTLNGVLNNSGTWGGGTDGHVVVNRDVYFGTIRPGYSAYTYPHPLTQGVVSYTISGTITVSGSPLANVAISGASCSLTNILGQYSCSVSSGFSGILTPSLVGYTFTPSTRSYSSVVSNQLSQNYTAVSSATLTISGTITINGIALPNVVLSGAPCTVTNSLGQYICTVNNGFSGTITPALSHYVFVPTAITYVTIASDQASKDYLATLTTNRGKSTFHGKSGVGGKIIIK